MAGLRSFANDTLQDNWFEDRLQEKWDIPSTLQTDGSGTKTKVTREEEGFPDVTKKVCDHDEAFHGMIHLHRHSQPESSRTIPCYTQFEKPAYETTTHKYQEIIATAGPHIPSQRRPMINPDNIHEIWRDRKTEAPETGYGATLPRHPPEKGQILLETTNQHFYAHLPKEARALPPPPDKSLDERVVGGYPASCNPNFPEKGAVGPNARMFFRHAPFHGEPRDKTLATSGFLTGRPSSQGEVHKRKT